MPRPEAVVFDIGNVLITWAPEVFFDRVLPDTDTRERLFAEVDLHAMNDQVDKGAPFRETVMATKAASPAWADEIQMWHDHWLDMASPAIEQSWALLRSLRGQGVPVFALSNFGIDTFAMAEPVYPILTEFDRRYISGHMGVIKPDPRIYEMVEADSGLSRDQLFFIDDRADNIAAAKARGWQGHQFTSPGALADALREVGYSV